jgi:hypothetical protein
MEANWRRYFSIKWMLFVVCAIMNTSISLYHIDIDIEGYRRRTGATSIPLSTTRALGSSHHNHIAYRNFVRSEMKSISAKNANSFCHYAKI